MNKQVDNSGRRGRRNGPGDASSGPADSNVFDQWEAANTGGLGGAGSVTRQKVWTTQIDDDQKICINWMLLRQKSQEYV